ncbi:MAG: TetR/AcrR family transcriptional regulator [Rhodobacteraceae bacterium]|nr:TetR/AcrR family transcriptional regulator [Paracoccaceae bacterium]
MPYTAEHKAKVRGHIVETARVLFNREGFTEVSIDKIMAAAGLTRGGFYNHFKNKEELYAEAVECFLNGFGKTWRDEAGVKPVGGGPETVRAMIESYLSDAHHREVDRQCPMIALPSDVARATPPVRSAYEGLLRAMTWLFENNLEASPETSDEERKERALALSAICVGGMVLSRTIDDETLASSIRQAARGFALSQVREHNDS